MPTQRVSRDSTSLELGVLKVQDLDAKLAETGNDGYQQPPSLQGPDFSVSDSSQLSPRFHPRSLVLGKGRWLSWEVDGERKAGHSTWAFVIDLLAAHPGPRLTMDVTPGGTYHLAYLLFIDKSH